MLWGKLSRVLARWDDSKVGHSQRAKPPHPRAEYFEGQVEGMFQVATHFTLATEEVTRKIGFTEAGKQEQQQV